MPNTRRPLSSILIACLLLLSVPGTLAHANDRTPRARPAYAAQVDSAYQRASRASRRITSMLDDARRSRDTRRVQCLDLTLSEMNSQVRLLGERAERLALALARGDENVARHEAALATYVARHLGEIERRAALCVGTDDLREGTRLIVEIRREPNAGEPSDPSVLPPTLPPPLPF
jgi:hypothetical protein